jgi:hypothetical protein
VTASGRIEVGAVLDEFGDELRGLLQLGVGLAVEGLCFAGHVLETPALSLLLLVLGGEASWGDVDTFLELVLHQVEHGAAAELVSLGYRLGLGWAERLRRVAAAAAGLEARERRRARADHQRTLWRTPPAVSSWTFSRA